MYKNNYLPTVIYLLLCAVWSLFLEGSHGFEGSGVNNTSVHAGLFEEATKALQGRCAVTLRNAIMMNNTLAADCLFAASVDVHIPVPYRSKHFNFDRDDVSLLFVAIDNDRACVVRRLLAAGISPHMYPNFENEFCPMKHAMIDAGEGVVQALWNAGARSHVQRHITEGAYFANRSALHALHRLAKVPANLTQLLVSSFMPCTAIIYPGIFVDKKVYISRKQQFVALLLRQFQSPSQRAAAAQKALFTAVGDGSSWAIHMLVAAGADVTKEDERGMVALDMYNPYSFFGHVKGKDGKRMLELLLDYGADIEHTLCSPGIKKGEPKREIGTLFSELLRRCSKRPGLLFLFERGVNFPTKEELDRKSPRVTAIIRNCAKKCLMPRATTVGKVLSQDCGLPEDLARLILIFSGIPAEYIEYGTGQNQPITSKRRKRRRKNTSVSLNRKRRKDLLSS